MNANTEVVKQVYVAPVLRPIELITEEVLVDNCKVWDGNCYDNGNLPVDGS
jgi:hypothetical protein